MRKQAKLIAAAALMLTGSIAALAQGPYHVQDKWKLGGDGGWDYLSVDPQSGLLYITRGNYVIAVDTTSGKAVADIIGLKGTHGVVFDTNGADGYISDGAGNAVAVFDRKSNKITQTIPTPDGINPDGILFEPSTHTVWAFNGRSKNATVIDAKTKKIIETVPLPGKPEFPVADGKGSVFVNIEDKNELVRLDANSRKLLAMWPICESPSGHAIDVVHNRLFSVCDGKKMSVTDASTGKVVATPEIGEGPDAAAFDPSAGYAFSSNGDGTLTVVHQDSPDSYSVVQNVATQRSARTMALDPKTGKIYLVAAEFGPRPAPTPENPRPRPPVVPGSFTVIVVSR